MTKEQVEKGNDLLNEIAAIEKFLEIAATKTQNRKLSHIRIFEHYGNSSNESRIDSRHTHLFIDIVKTLKSELEKELSEL